MRHLILGMATLLLAACGQPAAHDNHDNARMELLPSPDHELQPTPTGEPTVDYLMGRFEPSKHPDFAKVDKKYSDGAEYFMRKEAYKAFQQMHEAALKEGVKLRIISATRNFDRQKGIWEDKWHGRRAVDGKMLKGEPKSAAERALLIMRWSSMPGTSRHHWGTDIDINNLTNPYFQSGQGKKEYDWLVAHAKEYGFCQTYSAKGESRPHGYEEEKWHWSYTPLSIPFTKAYQKLISNGDIKGFTGCEAASDIQAVEKYVLGINQGCRH